MFHLMSGVSLADQQVEVSTVDLSMPAVGIVGRGFETCIFFEDGSSEVVEWYATEAQARVGHEAWSHPAVVGYVLAFLKSEASLNKIIEG